MSNTLRNLGLWGNPEFDKSMESSRRKVHLAMLFKETKGHSCPICGDTKPMLSASGDYRLRCHNGGTEWNPKTGQIYREGCQ